MTGSTHQRALDDLRVLVDQRQKHPRRSFRAAPPLLPVQERALLHPNAAGKFGLGEARARTDRLHIRFGRILTVKGCALVDAPRWSDTRPDFVYMGRYRYGFATFVFGKGGGAA